MIDAGLDAHQRAVMERVIGEEEAKRRHLVIALSGAHAYGFPSPDSDLDLKAIHVESTTKLLGLAPATPTSDRMEVIEGVEIDYTSNELKPVLIGVLTGNGNYLERILGPLLLHQSPDLTSLQPIARKTLSKRIYRHYLGFATSQRRAYEGEGGGTAKKLLYVLRTTLTGAHALRTGEIVTDLRELCDDYGFPEARELIEAKRAGERTVLSPELRAAWSTRMDRAFTALDDAHANSKLPLDPEGEAELEAWLLDIRTRAR
jgi:hypothetical protein